MNTIHVTIASLLIAVSTCTNLSAAEIVLRAAARPVGSIVRLGDVAELRGFDMRRDLSMRLVELVPSPPVESNRYLSAADVRDLLRRSGIDLADVSIVGAETVEIAWKPRPTTLADAQSNATEPTSSGIGFRSLGDELPTRARRDVVLLSPVQVDVIHDHLREIVTNYLEDESGKLGLLQVDFDLPQRDAEKLISATTELTISGGRAPWTGNLALTLSTETTEGRLQLPLRISVRDMTPVAVLTRPAQRDEVLTASHVVFEPAPEGARLAANATPITELKELIGREAARSLRAGQVLTTDLCLAPTMVHRGQLVSVVAAGGGIRIARQAIARTDGRQGDVIEVETTDTKDRLTARVVGSGQLAIVTNAAPSAPTATFDRTVIKPQPTIRQ